MPAPPFEDIRACVFDAYGTLFDVASAAERCRDVLGDNAAAFSELWRGKQLAYTWLRAAQGRHADFWQVTGEALDYTLESFRISDPALRTRLMGLYLKLGAFPDARDALTRLKRKQFATAILSNGSPPMLNAAIAHAGIAPLLDAVLSVEEARVFKPHPDVYRLAADRLRAPARSILFVSANGWDAYAASAFGMRVVWCNRYGQRAERLPGNPDCCIASLAELPALLDA